MNFKRTIIILIVVMVPGICPCESWSQPRERTVYDVEKDILAGIKNENVENLIRYVTDGVCFIDDCYKKIEVVRLLRNKNSWLYRKLFRGRGSIRAYILNADDLKMYVHEYEDFYGIAYVSEVSSVTRPTPPVITVRNENGCWRITDMDIY